jgi:hypothetical protein
LHASASQQLRPFEGHQSTVGGIDQNGKENICRFHPAHDFDNFGNSTQLPKDRTDEDGSDGDPKE